MTQDLILSAPLIYNASFAAMVTAGAALSTPVPVFPFAVGQYEPGTYVMLKNIENHRITPESLGYYSQIESYDIIGMTTVFTGSSPSALDSSPATDTITNCYATFYAVVMTTFMSNRTEPVFGVTPSPNKFWPNDAVYTAGPGSFADGPGGWEGTIEWSFHYEAYVTPA